MAEQNKQEEYFDLLLVEDTAGKLSVVQAPAHIADEDGMVFFNGGRIGRIRQRAYLFNDDPMAGLLKAIVPVFPAEAIFSLKWQQPALTPAGNGLARSSPDTPQLWLPFIRGAGPQSGTEGISPAGHGHLDAPPAPVGNGQTHSFPDPAVSPVNSHA